MPNIKQMATGIAFTVWACGLIACNNQQTTAGDAEKEDIAVQQSAGTNVNNPEKVAVGADGNLLLTAENGEAAGPEIKYMPEWKAFGWFTAADRVEWEVEVAKAGEYEVQLEWSVSDEEAGKEFLLQAGDQKLTGTIAKSGSWETFKIANVGRIKLKEGIQKVVFKPNTAFEEGGLLDLRTLKLVPVD